MHPMSQAPRDFAELKTLKASTRAMALAMLK
jgi:hypothetical protein